MDVRRRIAALRRELDVHRRPLDAEVGRSALLRRPAPREPRVVDALLELYGLRVRPCHGHDAGPFGGKPEQLCALRGAQLRALDTLGLDPLPVAAGAEHEVADLEPVDGLLALARVERLEERIRFLRFAAERPHGLACELVDGRLRRRVARRERA